MIYQVNILETDIEVYEAIKLYKMLHDGNSPTFREIVQASNASSTSHVRSILDKLQKAKYLRWYGVRQIELIGGLYSVSPDAKIPTLGIKTYASTEEIE